LQLEKQGIAQNEAILKAITDLTFTVRGVIEKRDENKRLQQRRQRMKWDGPK
jgi:hypothetical protein